MKRLSFVLLLISLLHHSVFAQGIFTAEPPTLRSFSPTQEALEAWALDSAKNLLYVGVKDQIGVFRLETGVVAQTYNNICESVGDIRRIEPHGSVMLIDCGRNYGKNVVINLQTGKRVREDLETISDNLTVAASCKDGVISIIDGAKVTQLTEKYFYCPNLRLSNDGMRLLINVSSIIYIVDVKTNRTISQIETMRSNPVKQTRLSIDGNTLMVVYRDYFEIYNVLKKKLLFRQEFRTHFTTEIHSTQFASDEDKVLISIHDYGSESRADYAYVYSLSSNTLQQTLNTEAVGFTDDGHYFVTLNYNQFQVIGNDAQNVWLREFVEVLVNTNISEARVSIDGFDRGLANDVGGDLKLYPGDYELVVTAPGYRPQSQHFTVEAGKPVSLNISLEKMRGILSFESEPSGATVTLDGKQIGVTPMTVDNLNLGTHLYSLTLDDYFESNGTVTITNETEQIIRGKLGEIPGLVFSSTPIGATIIIDGNTVGVTPIIVRNLKPGKVNFTATLEGYQSFTGRAIVPKNGKGEVKISLTSIAQLRKPWDTALKQAILLDNSPAFAVRDLLTFIKGLSYKPESLALFMNGKLLLRAFQPSPGMKGSLVVYKGSAYVPSGLLPLVGIGSRFISPILTLTLSGNTSLDFRFYPNGRTVTTTASIIKTRNDAAQAAQAQQKAEDARLERLQTQELALQEGVAKLLRNRYPNGPDFIYLGNNKWGRASWVNTDPPYAIITIVIASTTNAKTWKSCTSVSQAGWIVDDVGSSNGYLVVHFQSNYGPKIFYFDYAPGICELLN